MSFPKHGITEDSGVDWLGEAPKHWRVVPLKHIANFVNGAAFKPAEWAESGYPIIRIENLNGGENFNYFDGEPEQRYLVQDGALLFGWSGNRGTSFGPFRWSSNEVCVLNQHIFRVESHEMTTDELYWTLKAVTAHVEEQAHGIIGMVHITKGDLGSIKVPIPPPDEQKAISSFLDVETSMIDGLVSEQRRLIELLKEKRQAVISHAVTKGLNPKAPMKPSGIQWLGDVPQHWEIIKVRRVFEIKKRIAGELGYAVLSITQKGIKIKDLKSNDGQHSMDYSKYQLVDPGDFAMNHMDLLTGFIDIATVLGVTSPDYRVFRLRASSCCDPSFCLFIFQMGYQQKILFAYGQGSAQLGRWRLPTKQFRDLPFPKPPLAEQQQIAKFIRRELQKYKELSSQAERAIELLQERRTALISAAVTGKIDVREFADQETA